MKTVALGSTGLEVSVVGFGGSRIGGMLANKDSTRQALTVLHNALDCGITFYDTADMYAQGESEALIGNAFRGRRDKVVLATKAGYRLPAQRRLSARIKPLIRPIAQKLGLKRIKLPSSISGSLSQDFSPSYLTNALEQSLKRLGTDYVDVYQLHSPPIDFLQSDGMDQALATLEKLKKQGKIRIYGVATESPEDVRYCLQAPGLSTVQLGFGLLDLEALDQGLLETARERGLGVIARGCFGGGLLKDGPDEAKLMATTPKWSRILSLRKTSAGFGRPLLEAALQFCMGTPGVSVTLLGMHTEAHLVENLRCYQARPLTTAEYDAFRLQPGQS
jgi:aryl-alcohol dehydrogenase-like predicted oxidoreductase